MSGGLEWRGQDDADAGHLRAYRGAKGRHRLRRHGAHRRESGRGAIRRRRAGARRAPPVRGDERTRQSADGCLPASRWQGGDRRGPGKGACDVSDSAAAPLAGRRYAFRQRAADVRHCPRFDGPPAVVADRRALAWSCAARRGRAVRPPACVEQRGSHDSRGRAGCSDRARARQHRVRHGRRTGDAGRSERRVTR